MFLSVKSTISLIQNEIIQSSLAAITKNKGIKNLDQTGVLIKIFTNYFQIISVLATFQLTLPSGLTDSTDVIGNPVKQMSYSLDCFLAPIKGKIPRNFCQHPRKLFTITGKMYLRMRMPRDLETSALSLSLSPLPRKSISLRDSPR